MAPQMPVRSETYLATRTRSNSFPQRMVFTRLASNTKEYTSQVSPSSSSSLLLCLGRSCFIEEYSIYELRCCLRSSNILFDLGRPCLILKDLVLSRMILDVGYNGRDGRTAVQINIFDSCNNL